MTPTPDLETRILKMVSLFEGSAGGKINTYDEQYLSLGSIHYAVGQGSGARFLMRVAALDPASFRAILGEDFFRAASAGVYAVQQYCRVNVWRTGARWQPAFTRLSQLPAYATADAELARPYLDGGQTLAVHYGLHSERGLAFCVDRAVQQGWGVRDSVDAVYVKLPLGWAEGAVMASLATAYADSANPKYRNVVLARALTVAQGSSVRSRYPGSVDLERDFGLSGTRRWDGVGETRVFLTVGARRALWDGKPGAVYGGQPLTPAWVSQMALVYPPGTVTRLSPTLSLRVFEDGALLLTKNAKSAAPR